MTAPTRTLVDLAADADPRELECAVAVAIRQGSIDRATLLARLEGARGHRGVRTLRAILAADRDPALTRSAAEARFLALVRAARLPQPETNVAVDGYEIDFLWRAHRIAVEVDGYRFHGSRLRFERDRRRTARLAAQGIQVIPVTWRQVVDDGVATAVLLGQALARAEQR